MEVVSLPGNSARFIGSEDFELRLGALGAIGWSVGKFPLRAGIKKSLKALKREIESGRPF